MKKMVDQIKAGKFPTTKHLEDPKLVETANKVFLNAKIKDVWIYWIESGTKETESCIKRELGKKGIESIRTIYENISVSLSWLKGQPLENIKAEVDIEKLIKRLGEMSI